MSKEEISTSMEDSMKTNFSGVQLNRNDTGRELFLRHWRETMQTLDRIEHSRKCGPLQWRVLMHLGRSDARCSETKLAEELGLSCRQVQRVLSSLEKKGVAVGSLISKE